MRQTSLVVSALFYILAVGLAATLISSATQVASVYGALSAYQSANEKADTLVKNLVEELSLGLYQGGSLKAAQIAEIDAQAGIYAKRVVLSAWALLGVATLFLIGHFVRFRRIGSVAATSPPNLQPGDFLGHLLAVSGIFLAVGMTAPIMTIVARGEVQLLGDVVVQFDSRSVFGTVAKLMSTKNYFIGVLLLLFSVIIPVLKILLGFMVLSPIARRARMVALRIIHVIGSWSMTDVFVVAILLAFLAAETEQFTDATLGPGLYFFAGYGLLSLFAGQLLLRYRRALLAGSARST